MDVGTIPANMAATVIVRICDYTPTRQRIPTEESQAKITKRSARLLTEDIQLARRNVRLSCRFRDEACAHDRG